jgi:hypothetical protein
MAQAGKRHIDAQEMTDLVTRGVARPLMTGYDPVPVHHQGQWWHIPADAAPNAPYVPATAEQHQVFDDLAQRLALADAAVAADAERSS